VVTYYIDFEGGNDANNGTTFALRWRTITNGATAARIAPGDEIRIMASPDPTSIGSATWTGGGRPAAVSIQSSTNATPIRIQTISDHGLAVNDYVVITGHTVNTNANGVWKVSATPSVQSFEIVQINGTNTTGNGVGGSTGNITKANNLVVKTASPLVQNIALCGGLGQKPAWVASANITTTQSGAQYKEGNSSADISISVGFTTGKAAYYTLPATLDLSAFQQVSFWVRQASGTNTTAGQLYVALCTDTIGDTVAHQCNIPALGANGPWVPITVNLGTNLNAAIRSVALYVATDLGAQGFQIDNIVACKAASSADSVTLQSLVSKSDGTGDEAWYAIQSLNNDVIMLANANVETSQSANIRGYNGTTETVTTYKRETTKTTPTNAANADISILTDSGTSGNLITYSGGWNRTDMSTQTGQTWLDGQNGLGRGLTTTSARQFVSINRLNFCRYNFGITTGLSSFSSVNINSTYCTANTSDGVFFAQGSDNITLVSVWANNNGAAGVGLSAAGSSITELKLAANNATNGLSFLNGRYQTVGSVIGGNNGVSGSNADIFFTTCNNCTVGTATLTNGISSSGIGAVNSFNCSVDGGSTTGHSQGVSSFAISELYLNNFTINEATEVSSSGVTGLVYANRLDNTDNNSWVFQSGIGTVNQQTAVVDSPATTSWRMRPTGTSSALIPVFLKLGTVVCAASSAVTVTARMQRSNTGLTMRLICPGGQITGVSTSVSSDMTAVANTWETVSITFTPTKAGAVDIYAHAFGGTTFSGYVSNLTATQV
jgi:hypothetical protein